jgi:Tol biopolymer transport system component
MNSQDRNTDDMNRTALFSDDAIEAVFARRAQRGEPGDLRGRVLAATATTRQQRGPLAILRAGLGLGAMEDRTRVRAFVLVVALAALVALLIVTAIIGARLINARDERLTFVRDGDIYVANGDGTDVIRLLHVDGTTFSGPTWSPDGSRLAADSSGGAIIVDVRTGAIQGVGGTNPAWSPDGGRLAVLDVAADLSGRLRFVDARTGSSTTSASVAGFGSLAWSPNGRWIALTGITPDALLRIDTSTGAVVQIDTSFAHLDTPRDPSWSPDSTRIAFVRYNDNPCSSPPCTNHVIVADADGANAAELITGSDSFDEPAWSPDGRWIAVRSTLGPLDPTSASQGLIITRPDGTERHVVTSLNVDTYAWNPTSDGLRFTVRTGAQQPLAMWVASLDGVAHTLPISVDASTSQAASDFAWSVPVADQKPPPPSGAPVPGPSLRITTPAPAASIEPSGAWPIFATQAAGGCVPVRTDTNTGADTTVASLCASIGSTVLSGAWSPTGSTYAAVTQTTSAGRKLTLVRPDGSRTSAAIDMPAPCCVVWSPDGLWLAVSDDGAPGVIHLLRSDGAFVRNLPGTPSWTPDGRRLIVSAPDGTLLVGVPDGSDLRPIGSFPLPMGWATDNSRFAFARDGEIWTAAADGSDIRNVTSLQLGGAATVAWSPDGRWMGVAPGQGLWLMRSDGSERRFIDIGTVRVPLAWSPDGQRLAIDGFDPADGAPRVLLVAMDGSSAIAVEGASAPVWSADGRFLVVRNSVRGSIRDDYDIMNADGTGRALLRGPSSESGTFVWSH